MGPPPLVRSALTARFDTTGNPLANARGSDRNPLANARGSDRNPLANARGSDRNPLADARGSDRSPDREGGVVFNRINSRGRGSSSFTRKLLFFCWTLPVWCQTLVVPVTLTVRPIPPLAVNPSSLSFAHTLGFTQ